MNTTNGLDETNFDPQAGGIEAVNVSQGRLTIEIRSKLVEGQAACFCAVCQSRCRNCIFCRVCVCRCRV